jgi:uncharacterized membrane protein HdeD (DUF308 family)
MFEKGFKDILQQSYQVSSSSSLSEPKSPGWMRAAQIGLGIIAVIISIAVLVSPALSVVLLVRIVAIILLIVGIEKVLSGIFIPSKSRWGTIGLGIIVIILSIIVLSFPVGTTAFLIILLAIALLIDGIARVIHGITDKTGRSWSRMFRIAAGVIAIVLALVIIASPAIGAALVGILLGIALLIIGIEIIARGVAGRKISLTRS